MSDENGGVGFFATGLALMRLPLQRAMIAERNAAAELAQAQATERMMAEIASKVVPEDSDGFLPITLVDEDRDLNEQQQQSLRSQARTQSRVSPHISGYLRCLLRFVMGEGPKFRLEGVQPVVAPGETVSDEAQKTANERRAVLDAWWARFSDVNGWDQLEDEIVRRTWRDGEVFLRSTVHETDGPPDDWGPSQTVLGRLARVTGFAADSLEAPEYPKGMTIYRLVPPEHINDPKRSGAGIATHGIVTSEHDVQTVLAYLDTKGGSKVAEVIPADQMKHVKIGVDSDVKRGRSLVEVLLVPAAKWAKWLDYRMILNLVRSAVVLVKQYEKLTPAQIQGLRTANAATKDTGVTRRQKMLQPGTTVHAGPGQTYEFKAPRLQAQDAQHDGRSLLLTMCAATGMPEYIFTGDASNSNYASTLVAESPAVREFEAWRDFFRPLFVSVWREVMLNAVAHGALQGFSEADIRDGVVSCTFPPLLARNAREEAAANNVLHEAEVLSAEGWAEREGIDWRIEKARLDVERAEAGARAPDITGPDDDEDEDDDEGVGEALSEAERWEVSESDVEAARAAFAKDAPPEFKALLEADRVD